VICNVRSVLPLTVGINAQDYKRQRFLRTHQRSRESRKSHQTCGDGRVYILSIRASRRVFYASLQDRRLFLLCTSACGDSLNASKKFRTKPTGTANSTLDSSRGHCIDVVIILNYCSIVYYCCKDETRYNECKWLRCRSAYRVRRLRLKSGKKKGETWRNLAFRKRRNEEREGSRQTTA
jgi:hypothetical protein